jgi:hypothetical protein
MSLAYAVYPTAEEESTTQTIEQSRQGRNKTIKKRPAEHVQKIWNKTLILEVMFHIFKNKI